MEKGGREGGRERGSVEVGSSFTLLLKLYTQTHTHTHTNTHTQDWIDVGYSGNRGEIPPAFGGTGWRYIHSVGLLQQRQLRGERVCMCACVCVYM